MCRILTNAHIISQSHSSRCGLKGARHLREFAVFSTHLLTDSLPDVTKPP